jgi:transposase
MEWRETARHIGRRKRKNKGINKERAGYRTVGDKSGIEYFCEHTGVVQYDKLQIEIAAKKKTLCNSEQHREEVKSERAEWITHQKDMDEKRLIFVDEFSVNTGMTKLYGRATPGERVFDYVPDVRYESTTVLSSMRLNGDTEFVTFDGAVNGNVFKMYIERVLTPTLRAGDCVVMDSLSSHKVTGIESILLTAGVSMLFLPRYSPDLNPIEQMISKIKTALRRLKARSKELLHDAILDAFDSVSASDVSSWFAHSGYSLPFLNSL